MKIDSLEKHFVHELKDLHSAENQILKALPKMAEKASHPELRQAFEQHHRQTAAAQRVEHYEIAAYGTARTYARMLGRDDAVRLLQQTLDEEGETDKKLTRLAESRVNPDAMK